MNNLIVKRRGKLSDLGQIYALEKMIFKNEAWTIDMLKIELLCTNNSETLIIEENRVILGYFIYRKSLSEYHILNIGVSPHRQKEGIGGILLKDFLNDLENISTVFLEVKKSNFSAIYLYKKNGFKVCGERKKYYKDGSSALLMNYVKNIEYGLV